MAAVYRTLYEKYEQNDVLHVGIQEVVEAEKEIDTFLKSLDRNQRDQLDTLLGRLSRAYEMDAVLFARQLISCTSTSAASCSIIGPRHRDDR